MIASSLALALGASVASAQIIAPTFSGDNSSLAGNSSISWVDKNGFAQAQHSGMAKNIEFAPHPGSSNTSFYDQWITFRPGGNTFTFTTTNNGLWLNDTNADTLSIQNGNAAAYASVVSNFVFNGTTNYNDTSIQDRGARATSLIVKQLNIKGGRNNERNNYNTNLTFAGDMIGNTTLFSDNGWFSNAKFTFNDNASYWGNLEVQWGKAQMLFDTGDLTGDITLTRQNGKPGAYDGIDQAYNGGIADIQFGTKNGTQVSDTSTPTTNTLTGNLINNMSPRTLSVTFWKAGGSIIGDIITVGAQYADEYGTNRTARVNVTFKDTGSIVGDIYANTWTSHNSYAETENNIVFEKGGSIGTATDYSSITSAFGHNTITFAGDGQVYANFSAQDYMVQSLSTIVFNGKLDSGIAYNNPKNFINVSGTDEGKIIADSTLSDTGSGSSFTGTIDTRANGSTAVVFAKTGHLYTSSITNTGGSNTYYSYITFNGNDSVLDGITVGSEKQEATLQNNNKTFVTFNGDNSSATFKAVANANAGETYITFAGDNSSVNLGDVSNIIGSINVQFTKTNATNNSFSTDYMYLMGGGVYGDTMGTTLVSGDGLNITAKAIVTNIDYNNAIKTTNTFTTNNGNFTSGFIGQFDASAYNANTGGAINTITVDNSAGTSKTFLLSVIDDSNTSSLTLRGGNLSGSRLAFSNENVALTNIKKIDLTGNVALFNSFSSGVNTINVKNNNTSTAYIVGDIVTIKGTNNISFTDSNTSGAVPAIIGNIRTDGGYTNISLENSLWAPNNLVVPEKVGSDTKHQNLLKAYVETYGTGKITTNGGTTTVVSRLNADLVGSLDDTHPLDFRVDANGGETNIIMQINNNIKLNTRAIINYSGNGVTNLVFANSNNSAKTGDVIGGTNDGSNGAAPTESYEAVQTNSSTNKFFGLTYQDGVKFKLQSATVNFGNEKVNLIDKYGAQFSALNAEGDVLTLTSKRDNSTHTDNVEITGLAMGEISSLISTGGASKTYNNTLTEGSAFVGSIDLDTTVTSNLTMEANTKLILTGDKATMAALTLSGNQTTIDTNQLVLETLNQTKNRIINLATNGGSTSAVSKRSNFRLLEIGSSNGGANTGLLGDANETIVFTSYVNTNAKNATLGGVEANTTNSTYGYAKSDRIIIHDVGNTAGKSTAKTAGSVYLQFAIDADTNLGSIKYNETLNSNSKGGTAVEGNVAVLTVKNSANGGADKALIKLETKDTLQGFDVISGTIKGVATDQYGVTTNAGTGDYTTYFITSLSTTGADSAIQDTVSSAFATSLDIYAANFNSLNKRMGELRDNANSQGAWGRVFGGQQTSDFGMGSKTTYVTVQAGYDYAFGFEGANNYLGFALAYSNSSSKTSNATNTLNGVSEGLDGDMKSNMVEVGIYNAYVQDEGWYNDSIFKFSYIMNDFSTTGTASGNSVSTTNYGIVLSDEFGYRFKLGDAKEWYIDPQLEVAFGYVNGTEYTLTSGRSELQAKSDSLMQLRARFGSSFGYDFKQFTQGKGVDAKLYVGAFYEYDYFNGGDLTLTTNLGGVNSIQSALSSDGRVVVNVGTNMTVKENTRIYFDFETSFAGKIRTDYQANVGVRYSFGENVGYTPLDPNKKSITPLKVSDENAKENSSTETKSTEQTNEVSPNPETNTQEKAQ